MDRNLLGCLFCFLFSFLSVIASTYFPSHETLNTWFVFVSFIFGFFSILFAMGHLFKIK